MSATHHCEHGVMIQCGPNDWDPDVECCICCDSPCPKVDVPLVMEHERAELAKARDAHAAAIAYVLEHGKREEAPF